MSEQLKRLTEDGRHLVSDGFLKGDVKLTTSDLEDHIEPVSTGAEADLERLDALIDDVVESHPRYETDMDSALVKEVHQTLDLSRRTAADPGLWHWLAVVRYDHFVRHRWEYSSEAAMREKFLGAGSDLYSNAIHRLWWIAELTARDGDYTLTDNVFSNQTLVNKVFDRWFARYQPATVALCEELADEPSWLIDEVTRRFNHALTRVQLEGLDQKEVRRLVKEIKADL